MRARATALTVLSVADEGICSMRRASAGSSDLVHRAGTRCGSRTAVQSRLGPPKFVERIGIAERRQLTRLASSCTTRLRGRGFEEVCAE